MSQAIIDRKVTRRASLLNTTRLPYQGSLQAAIRTGQVITAIGISYESDDLADFCKLTQDGQERK